MVKKFKDSQMRRR